MTTHPRDCPCTECEDTILSAIAQLRLANDDGYRISLEEVAARDGYNLDALAAEPDGDDD